MKKLLSAVLVLLLVGGCATARKKTAASSPPVMPQPAIQADLASPAASQPAKIAPIPPPASPPPPSIVTMNGAESYAKNDEVGFQAAITRPLSTFSVDVDRASYANVRRFLMDGRMPPPDAVRIEELINYFDYSLGSIPGSDPLGASVEIASCPWQPKHRLAMVALHARDVDMRERPAANIVFLLDCSGSMEDPDKLPLLKEAMKLFVRNLEARDRVAIVTYSNRANRHLPSTSCEKKGEILAAIDALRAEGSTNGGDGIRMAYSIARRQFGEGQINRVILATDGDFNTGTTDQTELNDLITSEAKSGVFLTVLGMGTGNLKDSNLESLADKGNGVYAYLDSFNEAHRVLVEQMGGALITLAKDVKIQVEFNPAQVGAYRLIGYENRALAAQDFNNDKKDAGDMGAGQSVIALYELVPAGQLAPDASVDPLKYQAVPPGAPTVAAQSSKEVMTVKWRFKTPQGSESVKRELAVEDAGKKLESASGEYKFAVAVAGFGMLLRNSPYVEEFTFKDVVRLAQQGIGNDADGYRGEFLTLVEKARGQR